MYFTPFAPPVADFEMRRFLCARKFGAVPDKLMRLEVLIEDLRAEDNAPTGQYRGQIVLAHGWDQYGTFTYRKWKRKQRMRRKEYRWFPADRDVVINVVEG